MVHGMAAIAERDQVRWFIDSTCSSRNQMVNVCFSGRAELTALLTAPAIASEHNSPHVAPALCTRIGA